MTARATIQGDVLGIKDSGEGAGNTFQLVRNGDAGEGPSGTLSLLCRLSQGPQGMRETRAPHWLLLQNGATSVAHVTNLHLSQPARTYGKHSLSAEPDTHQPQLPSPWKPGPAGFARNPDLLGSHTPFLPP